MSNGPVGVTVRCPSCDAGAIAIVPQNSEIVQREDESDGKVRVDCKNCDETFLAYFRADA